MKKLLILSLFVLLFGISVASADILPYTDPQCAVCGGLDCADCDGVIKCGYGGCEYFYNQVDCEKGFDYASGLSGGVCDWNPLWGGICRASGPNCQEGPRPLTPPCPGAFFGMNDGDEGGIYTACAYATPYGEAACKISYGVFTSTRCAWVGGNCVPGVSCAVTCGNGFWEQGETHENCPADVPEGEQEVCDNDNECENPPETCSNCPNDCHCDPVPEFSAVGVGVATFVIGLVCGMFMQKKKN
jgi:hypothetical protein